MPPTLGYMHSARLWARFSHAGALLSVGTGQGSTVGAHRASVQLCKPSHVDECLAECPCRPPPSLPHLADAIHAFTQNESDWGFTTFFTMTELQDPKNGWLVNDSVLLSVDLHVERDEKYNFDARKATGFVGLKNQGATCYMNSLLQYLYNLAFFRKVRAA